MELFAHLNPYPQQWVTVRKVHPMANKGAQKPLGATEARLRPGEYPLGSAQSRAAARALLERRFAGRRRIDVVSSVPRPGGDGGIRVGTWVECDDGSLFRLSNLPPGITIKEAERIVSQPVPGKIPGTREDKQWELNVKAKCSKPL